MDPTFFDMFLHEELASLSGSVLPGLPLTTSTCTPWAVDLDTEDHDIYNLYKCEFGSFGAPAEDSAAIAGT